MPRHNRPYLRQEDFNQWVNIQETQKKLKTKLRDKFRDVQILPQLTDFLDASQELQPSLFCNNVLYFEVY